MAPNSIVFGAGGFIGRSLVAELLARGDHVAAGVRDSGQSLVDWLGSQGCDTTGLTIVTCDITEDGLGLDTAALGEVRDVYNAAARMAFGLSVEEARRVNVTGALNVLEWAAALDHLRRVVHITGYRVDVHDSGESSYDNGAYGASKFEAHHTLVHRAQEKDIPLTIANPSSVIGPGQYFGLADVVRDLWSGRLRALPGDHETFVPVVTLDYFVRFLATLPLRAETTGRSFTVLDPATPNLKDLVGLLAEHLGVRAPKLSVPTGLIKRLPSALTGTDPEGLEFIANDRYDTSAADEHAHVMGLRMPPIDQALRNWADHLVAARFGAVQPLRPSGFHQGTWITGDREQPEYVLLHGLPIDSDAWTDLIAELGPEHRTLTADLPGLGRSAPVTTPLDHWLTELLRSVATKPVLVAHSLGCEPAVRYAAAHPDRISGLVLISPYFLQAPASRLVRSRLAAISLRRSSPAKLAALLGVPAGPAIDSAAANLRRPGVAGRTVAALRVRSTPQHRRELADLLNRIETPVQLINGSSDPLTETTRHPTITVDGTGHYPLLTHPDRIAAALRASITEPA